jgi:hypothetical protein
MDIKNTKGFPMLSNSLKLFEVSSLNNGFPKLWNFLHIANNLTQISGH